MIVWLVARNSGQGLQATAHRTQKKAFDYLRYLYPDMPSYIAMSDVLGWIGANTDDDVLVDYDDADQEP